MTDKTPEQLQAEANVLNAQANKLILESQQLRNRAGIISQISTLLIIGGITIPCLCIVVMALLSDGK